MNLSLLGLITVAGVATVAATIAFAVRRLGSGEDRTDHNEAIGQVFTIVGGLHAVLMAFVLISLFDAASEASEDSFREANSLVAVGWAADSLDEPARSRIHELSRSYVNTVIEDEWPRLHAELPIDNTGSAQLDELRLAIEQAETSDDWQHERKLEAAGQLWEVYQARQERLDASRGGVGLVVWFALIAGSLMSLTLPYLFGGTRLATHVVIVSILAATIAMLLFAIYQMQNPFSGGASVDPEAFRSALYLLG